MNTSIKKLAIDALTSPLFARAGRRLFGHGIPVFMLHRVDSKTSRHRITAEYLRKCLQFLSDNHYTFISLYNLVTALREKQELPDKCVVFTMDDGFEEQISHAATIFMEFECPVTIFLITDMLDGKLWPWDDRLSYLFEKTTRENIRIDIGDEHVNLALSTAQETRRTNEHVRNLIKAIPASEVESILSRLEIAAEYKIPESPPIEYKPLSWNLAREYEARGVDFAPHTRTHRIMSKMDAETMKSEILGSWQRLKEELASPKPVLAYPTGRYCDFGSREVRFLRETEIIGAVSTIPAQVRPEKYNDYYIYSLPRYSMPKSFEDFRMYCSWIEYTKERNLKFWPS